VNVGLEFVVGGQDGLIDCLALGRQGLHELVSASLRHRA
jgi:hypothetical protein